MYAMDWELRENATDAYIKRSSLITINMEHEASSAWQCHQSVLRRAIKEGAYGSLFDIGVDGISVRIGDERRVRDANVALA